MQGSKTFLPIGRRAFVAGGLLLPAASAHVLADEPGLSDVHVVAADLRFPEGPVAMPDGSLLFVEILGGTVSRLTPEGKVSAIASGLTGPNGLAMGPDGACYVCQNGGRPDAMGGGKVQRLDLATGEMRLLYDKCEGRRFDGPNDLVFDKSGGMWISDFIAGAIFWAKADGSEVRLIDGNVPRSNGIALSPDGGTLYIAQQPRKLLAYRITAPGRVAQAHGRADARLLSDLDGNFRYDSMKTGADGDVYVAAWWGGILRLSPTGKLKATYAVPDWSITNLSFGGRDRRDLFLTGVPVPAPAPGAPPPSVMGLKGSLFKARAPAPGLRLNYT